MKRLVLFNGGLKSTFLAELAKREGEVVLCYCILNPEDEARKENLLELGASMFGIRGVVTVILPLFQSPPLEEVLLRMLYLILHAVPVAKQWQCDCIYHGLSQDDDARIIPVVDAYVKQLGALIELAQPLYNGKGIWLGNVAIETPLRRLDRARVIRLGNEWNIPWERTHSCSQNQHTHCGTCQNCLRRKYAFKREGHYDQTLYKE